jgi:hypothetical protein
MKVLHILKSPPDDTVRQLFDALSRDTVISVVELYDPCLDWDSLVTDIFDHDKVICWW